MSRSLHYDIFLSFRGPDTRYSFTDHLKTELARCGYLVFYDDEGIPSGKEIRSELPKAIQESTSSIIVLSPNYASSKWCLNELVHIMKRQAEEEHYVLPVFYHVNPSDVRHQKNSFANSFFEHEGSFKEEIVKEWREALTKFGGLKGILVEELKTKEAEVIQQIIEKVGELIGTRKYQFLTSELVGHGFERAKDEIWSLLMKDGIDKIGAYGMGGVGKTTLMTHIYNQLLERSDSFPPCHWVTVSQDFSIYKLQDSIAKAIRINISKEDDDIRKRAAKLYEELVRKQKFILVLDDLSDDFDTKDVGLPVGPNGCKLVFTTRSYEVCRKMGCKNNSVKVEPLLEEEALYLFKKEIENIEIDDEALLKSVVRECARLPLAIKVMARSMKGVDDVHEWKYTLAQLRDSKFTKDDDMERNVFAVLRLSYARLTDPSLQECFLYCALFPEDTQIYREELIELLICEGIIEEGKSRQEEVYKGHFMLNKLEGLCLLLEDYSLLGFRAVKMHDLIRDVALQELRVRSVVMIEAGKQLRVLPDVGKWSINLHRASFINNYIKNIPSGKSPCCPDLSTLLLSWNRRLRYIGDSFFEEFNGLKILDLSGTGIEKLPSSISNLVRLTGLFLSDCRHLRHVPSLAKLQELKALDLYETALRDVPHGMDLLYNLRYLNIYSYNLKEFPSRTLPNLSCLQFLVLHYDSLYGSLAIEEEVGGLRNLEVLVCCFDSLKGLNRYLQTQKHEKPLVHFHLFVNCRRGSLRRYPTAKRVEIEGQDITRKFDKLPPGIEELELCNCKCPRSLLVPISNATELKFVEIAHCEGIECLASSSTSSGSSVDVLNKLERLKLSGLKSLCFLFPTKNRKEKKGLYFPVKVKAPHQVLPCYGSTFIHLKELNVYRCDGMKTLFPLGLLQNLKNLEDLLIQGCEGMEEIIESTEESGRSSNISSEFSLPKLRRFRLYALPRLTSICDRPLICESLLVLVVGECEMLKKIPVAPPLPSLGQGVFDSTELLEQFERDHPIAKDILQYVPYSDRSWTSHLSYCSPIEVVVHKDR